MAKKQLTAEQRKEAYFVMYKKISLATAEVKSNGKVEKTKYVGKVSELFGDTGVSSGLITHFLWAVSHKTESLPTTLFKITKVNGGMEIIRLHSGFYDNAGEHIVGAKLIPFIMKAATEYKPCHPYVRKDQPAKTVETAVIPAINVLSIDWVGLSDDELANVALNAQNETKRREELREKRARLQEILELAEMSKDDLLDLLGTV